MNFMNIENCHQSLACHTQCDFDFSYRHKRKSKAQTSLFLGMMVTGFPETPMEEKISEATLADVFIIFGFFKILAVVGKLGLQFRFSNR